MRITLSAIKADIGGIVPLSGESNQTNQRHKQVQE